MHVILFPSVPHIVLFRIHVFCWVFILLLLFFFYVCMLSVLLVYIVGIAPPVVFLAACFFLFFFCICMSGVVSPACSVCCRRRVVFFVRMHVRVCCVVVVTRRVSRLHCIHVVVGRRALVSSVGRYMLSYSSGGVFRLYACFLFVSMYVLFVRLHVCDFVGCMCVGCSHAHVFFLLYACDMLLRLHVRVCVLHVCGCAFFSAYTRISLSYAG